MRVLVTGGCGFIGSALVRRLVGEGHDVLNIDKMTYAADPAALASVDQSPNYALLKTDICDGAAVAHAFEEFRPHQVYHLAAESHVDRSIDGPSPFIESNIIGTFRMLEAALRYLPGAEDSFRMVHVSTDEVYGTLGGEGLFTEESSYAPNSPYSASKAAADHLARAWFKTFALPVVISNCSNNFGPYQNREKLIPTIIRKALTDQPIPIYGTGRNVRDWLYVEDHVDALLTVGAGGRLGEKYNIGGDNEIQNIDIANMVCALLDERAPRRDGRSYASAITFVEDRPGHDLRYAIDASKARDELGWSPKHDFAAGLRATVEWYIANPAWTGLESSDGDDRLGRPSR